MENQPITLYPNRIIVRSLNPKSVGRFELIVPDDRRILLAGETRFNYLALLANIFNSRESDCDDYGLSWFDVVNRIYGLQPSRYENVRFVRHQLKCSGYLHSITDRLNPILRPTNWHIYRSDHSSPEGDLTVWLGRLPTSTQN